MVGFDEDFLVLLVFDERSDKEAKRGSDAAFIFFLAIVV